MSALPPKYRRWFRGAADYGPLLIFALAYFLKVRLVDGAYGTVAGATDRSWYLMFGGNGWHLAMGGAQARDLTGATWWLVGASMIGIIASLLVERRLAPIPLIMGGVALVFGILTLVFHDPIFLKLKPTIVDTSYAVGLLVAWLIRRNPLKALMGSGINLSDHVWRALTLRYALFFLASGIVNIVVWQTLSESMWVIYKVGGQLVLLVAFSLTQVPYLMKHMEEDPPEPAEAEAEV
ncbi:MAG: intracellular septation protein [Caulobacter sp.]|nr:intracellular septation protein [Caulobacter sp.]